MTETMDIERVPIATLHHDPANVRRHPEKNLDAIKASLARFGQQKPIVVSSDNVVVAGNGTLAAERLGRRCMACEIDPAMADNIIARWESETGGVACLST